MKKIIINLKDLRKSRELTQQELASNLGVSRQSIIAVEAGKFLPSIELAWEIANFFDLTVDQLFKPCDYQLNNSAVTAEEREDDMSRDIIEWDPSKELTTFRTAMDRLVEDFFGDDTRKKGYFPNIEISQTKNAVIVKAEIPGVEPNDITVSIENDLLVIEGERKIEKEDEDKNWHRREIGYGKFSRTISLPHLVSSDEAEAKFKNGMLIIQMPLLEEAKTKVKKIKIETEK
jgi:HSP20 family protein